MNQRWWCEGGSRSREYLFGECSAAWEKEIRTLWKEGGGLSSQTDKGRSEDMYSLEELEQAGGASVIG